MYCNNYCAAFMSFTGSIRWLLFLNFRFQLTNFMMNLCWFNQILKILLFLHMTLVSEESLFHLDYNMTSELLFVKL